MDDDQEAMNPSRRQQQPVSLGGGGTRHVQFGGGVVDGLGSQGHRGGQRPTAGRGVSGGLDLGVGLSNRQGTASVLGIGPSQHQVKVSDLFINYWTWAMDLRCILWLAGSCNGDQPGNKPESATGLRRLVSPGIGSELPAGEIGTLSGPGSPEWFYNWSVRWTTV